MAYVQSRPFTGRRPQQPRPRNARTDYAPRPRVQYDDDAPRRWPSPASAETIARAEIAHMLRFPDRYGLSAGAVRDIKADPDKALRARIQAVKKRLGGRRA